MTDNSKIVFSGGAGAAIGVAIGMLFGGPDVSGIEDQVGAASSEVTSISAQLSELGQRLDTLETAVSAEPEATGLNAEDLEAAISGATGDLNDRLAEIETSLTGATEALSERIESADAAQVDAIIAAMDARYEERMKEYRERMEARREHGGERRRQRHGKDGQDTAAPEPETNQATPAQLPAMEATTQETAPARIVTETLSLADGKIRAYISGYLAEEDIARVAINGFTVSEIRKGRSAEVEVGSETCSVTFNGVVDNHVQLEARCE